MVYQEDNNTIVLVLEQGEDIVEAVTDIARDKNGKFGTVSGIGAPIPLTVPNFPFLSRAISVTASTISSPCSNTSTIVLLSS